MDDRHIELKDFQTSFDLPDVITARMRLAYKGAIAQSYQSELFMIQRWNAYRRIGLLTNWQSKVWPNLDDDILESDDPQAANLVIAVVNSVFMKMNELENIEKK